MIPEVTPTAIVLPSARHDEHTLQLSDPNADGEGLVRIFYGPDYKGGVVLAADGVSDLLRHLGKPSDPSEWPDTGEPPRPA